MPRFVFLFLLAALLSAQSVPEVEITAEPHHHLVFSNAQVRVFSVYVPPHSETLMHWHRHDYLYVTLGANRVVNAIKGQPPVTVDLQDGETRFIPTGFAHIARNPSGRPFLNVTIELLQDETLRHSPAPWDQDRGLDILHGGTREILFVKDAVRVSDFELQPRGMSPVSPAPYLLVAVSDLQLLQTNHNAPTHASDSIRLKPGEVLWVPAHHRSTLTNMGRIARFVTLEFP